MTEERISGDAGISERRQVGLKLQTAQVERLDSFAESCGLSRTDAIERAIDFFIDSAGKRVGEERESLSDESAERIAELEVALAEARAMQARALPDSKSILSSGRRIARVCTHKDCVPPYRKFGDPDWNCPEHGPSFTVAQENRPYMGQTT